MIVWLVPPAWLWKASVWYPAPRLSRGGGLGVFFFFLGVGGGGAAEELQLSASVVELSLVAPKDDTGNCLDKDGCQI